LTYKGAFVGVGGKFDGGGGRILGGPQKDMIIAEQEFQLSNAAASDSAVFKNRKSYINRLGISKTTRLMVIARGNMDI
jgi:hypothetical protein